MTALASFLLDINNEKKPKQPSFPAHTEANRNQCQQRKVNVSRVPIYLVLISNTDSQQTVDLHQFHPQEHDAELQEDNLM